MRGQVDPAAAQRFMTIVMTTSLARRGHMRTLYPRGRRAERDVRKPTRKHGEGPRGRGLVECLRHPVAISYAMLMLFPPDLRRNAPSANIIS